MKKLALASVAVLLTAVLLSAAVTIVVTPSAPEIVVGATSQLVASPSYTKMSWRSSDTTVATVSASGLVRGIAAGTATITASYKNNRGTATVTVTDNNPVVVTCPATITQESLDGNAVAVTLTGATSTGGTAPVTITYSPASASSFDVGVTTVNVTATDSAGRFDTCSFYVEVTYAGLPEGWVSVATNESIQTKTTDNAAGTTFYIEAGTHTQQTVVPKSGNTYVCAPGAILDGQNVSLYAFYASTPSSDVTVSGCEIKNYASPDQYGAFRGDGGTGWIIEDNLVHDNRYSGIRIGPAWQVRRNKIYRNGVIGLSGFRAHGSTIEDNELYQNNLSQLPEEPVLAAASGIKLGETGTTIVRRNYVHDNYAKGIWTDHCHAGNSVSSNTIVDNVSDGVMVEISCQTLVADNTITGNALGQGFPAGGVKIVSSRDIEVARNMIQGNQRGVVANQSSTLTWSCGTLRVQNLNVHDNTIIMSVGQTGLASTGGDTTVFTSSNNHFTNNHYKVTSLTGGWFLWNGLILNWTQWKAALNDTTGTFELQ